MALGVQAMGRCLRRDTCGSGRATHMGYMLVGSIAAHHVLRGRIRHKCTAAAFVLQLYVPILASAERIVTFGDSYTDFGNALQEFKGVLGVNTVGHTPKCFSPARISAGQVIVTAEGHAGLARILQLQTRFG